MASAQIAEPEAAQALCDLWGRKARLHIHIGQLPAARSALDEAVALLPLVEDPERHAVILSYIAITIFYAGDFDRAAEMMTTALRLAEETGDEKGIAFAHGFLGSCAKALGDYVTAENQFKQSIRHYRQIDDELGAAMSLNNLGNVAQARGDFAGSAGPLPGMQRHLQGARPYAWRRHHPGERRSAGAQARAARRRLPSALGKSGLETRRKKMPEARP
ncbi:MAG: tetratricopeptide repeat protein [Chloroflexi bacterium]|nr:tetratricopeptide repeat protein [Chloroflexota bacterium]